MDKGATVVSDSGKKDSAQGRLHRKGAAEDVGAVFHKAILNNIPDIAWVKNISGHYQLANEALARECGLTIEELANKTDFDIWPEELARKYRDDDARVIVGRTQLIVEERFVGHDGTERWVESVKSPIFDHRGEPIGTAGIARDITERRFQARLSRVMARVLRTFLESEDEALYGEVLDIILEETDSEFGFFGYVGENGDFICPSLTMHAWEVCTMPQKTIVFPKHAWAGLWGRTLSEGVVCRANYRLNVPMGHVPLDRAVTIPILHQGIVIGSFGVANRPTDYDERDQMLLETIASYMAPVLHARLLRDRQTAERVHAEKLLRHSEEILRSALHVAGMGHWEYDIASGQFAFNDQYYRLHQITAEQAGGYQMGAEQFAQTLVFPDDAPMIGHLITMAVEAENADFHYDTEARILTYAGEMRWVRVWFRIEKDVDGKTVKLYGVNQDITERKQTEDARIEMERRLLHAQRLESLGVLAGGIAHDFNNLLMAILGNLDLAIFSLPASSQARDHVEKSIRAARRAADLTRQMLAYSGKGRFMLERIDISQFMRDNAHLFEASIPKKITVLLRLQGDLPEIEADPGQLQQIVMNLITNAAEAIGEREGTIAIETGVAEYDAAYLRRSRTEEKPMPGQFVHIEVKDSGCGMDEETLQRLFDPFYTTKFMGRGLGMSAILGIVRGHGGSIVVDSSVESGTTIRVLLPVAECRVVVPAVVDDAGGVQQPISAGTQAVLVVDDEDMVRDVCKKMVERLGITALEACNGEDAVRIYAEKSGEISCVLMDFSMPRMDGIAAFAEIRKLDPAAKVLLSSGYDEDDATRRFSEKGLAGFIQKPYEMERLKKVLLRVLSG